MDPEYAEVFGLDPDADTDPAGEPPANDPEADPTAATEAADGQGDTGAEEPPTDAQEGQEGQEGGEEGPQGAPAQPQQPGQLSPEERHRQAELRRQREEAARQQAEQARIDAVYERMFRGQVSPFTGKPITTEAEFRAYEQAKAQKTQEDALKKVGLEPEVITSLVDQRLEQHPAVIQAKQALRAAQQAQTAAAEREARAAIDAELQKISAVDPSVRTLDDIARMPTAQQFNRYVQQGLSLEDAFFLANRQDILSKRQAAAKQAAINQTRSKAHLDSGAGAGGAGLTVPPDKAAEYRAWFPDATDAEIAKEYEKYQKSLRK